MPFVIVFGMPKGTPQGTLQMIRREMVQTLSSMIPAVKPHWVNPRFPADLVDDPVAPEDGGQTVFIQLNTAMFAKAENPDELAPQVTRALCEIVHRALKGTREVECMVMAANPAWISVLEAVVPD